VKSVRPACIDASFALSLVLPGALRGEVRDFWTNWIAEERVILAPRSWVLDVTNALGRLASRNGGGIGQEQATEALDYLLDLPVALYDIEAHAMEMWREVMVGMGVTSAYDASYVLAALQSDAELWTCDPRIAEQVGRAEFVRFLRR
jgi:predicted nucleic acid-binding protein